MPEFERVRGLYFGGFVFPCEVILFTDTNATWSRNENIQTFLLITTYTSCEYSCGIFYLRQTLFIYSALLKAIFPLQVLHLDFSSS